MRPWKINDSRSDTMRKTIPALARASARSNRGYPRRYQTLQGRERAAIVKTIPKTIPEQMLERMQEKGRERGLAGSEGKCWVWVWVWVWEWFWLSLCLWLLCGTMVVGGCAR